MRIRGNSRPGGSSPPGRGFGKGMALGAWLVAGALLFYFFDDLLDKQENPNRNPEAMLGADGWVEVVLQRNRRNHYVTGGMVNNEKVTFLLDTGATDVVIPEDVAYRIGLTRGRKHKANTANGVIEVYETRLSRLSIGGLTLFDVDASINPYMQGEEILLGMSALGQVDIEQKGEELRLRAYQP